MFMFTKKLIAISQAYFRNYGGKSNNNQNCQKCIKLKALCINLIREIDLSASALVIGMVQTNMRRMSVLENGEMKS